MLVEPDRTPYDLQFRLLGFPVRVHPFFWLFSALLGGNLLALGVTAVLVWIGCVFVSILVHELGHALAFRWFGADCHITLYAFGGLAVPWSPVAGRWRRAAIALAGPAAGFTLWGVLAGVEAAGWVTVGAPWLVQLAVAFLWFINLFWNLINLLPVWPLDGGQVCREVATVASPRNGKRVALEVSVAVGGLLAVYSVACALNADGFRPEWLPRGSWWTAILFGVLAAQSFQLLQMEQADRGRWDEPDDDRPPWRR